MADSTALRRAFEDYARTIARQYDVGEVLYRLTDQCSTLLRVDAAGVSLADADGSLQFVTATDERATTIEEAQIRLGSGACHEAYRLGKQIVVDDLEHEDRWPDYRRSARELGFSAVAGIPMSAMDERIGALNLYHCNPRRWDRDELELAQLLADMASGYVANARSLSQKAELAEQLQHALDSRVVIEQAKGILAERHGISTAAAFEGLRRHARRSNRRIHDVAREVVEGRLQL